MLQVHDLSIAYPPQAPILSSISFHLPSEGVFALMGPSGLGKTSLLKAIAGLLQPVAGSIQFSEPCKPVMLFQEDRLLPWCSALKNVCLGMTEPDESVANALLRRMGIDAVDALPGSFSGGMQRRVALARALAAGGDMLLLDEPFTGMDATLKGELAPIIREFGKLIVFSTHDKADAELMAAKLMLLQADAIDFV